MLNLTRSRNNIVKISLRIDHWYRATIDALLVDRHVSIKYT